MKDIKDLYKRLEKVNTELNEIEEGWPWRGPTNKKSTLEFDIGGAMPEYGVLMMKAQGERLLKKFPKGWEFRIHAYVWGGQDTGCIIDIFINGGGFSSVRFCVGGKSALKTKAHCVGACIDQLPTLVTNTIARMEKYPTRTFASAKYKKLCELRKKLNGEWQAIPETRGASVPGPYAYPYGKHKKDWPVFEGMQLGN
jgi:hypothetical protein